MTNSIELVIDAQATLGEGPCWHSEKQQLYWVDIVQKQLHIYDPACDQDRIIQVQEFVSCVVPRQSGGVILSLQSGLYSLDLETEELTYLTKPEDLQPTHRFNDGKCDPRGRFIVGSMSLNETPNTGSLYSLDNNQQIKKLLSNLSISNGLGWSLDYSVMYLIDSPTKNIFAFDYNLETGEISNQRIAITIPEQFADGMPGGYPDGMTVDEEGMIWVALWAGFKVTRWNPDTGELLETLSIPAPNVTSCTFGGVNRNELYITTARRDLSTETLEQYPHAGGVFRLITDVKGMETFSYCG